MKSPVKPSSYLGEPSCQQQDFDHKAGAPANFETMFEELALSASASRPWVFEKGLKSGWEEFDEFDPELSIASSNSSTYSSSAGSVGLRRVHFVETGPGDKDILRTEYKSTVDYDSIRDQWYTAADFRKFRSMCQEVAITASQDELYCKDFFKVYNELCVGNQVTPTEERAYGRLDFSDYRGLERAIFRQTLITDKFSNIKGIVLASRELAADELSEVSKGFTTTARFMARHLAMLDRLVVDFGLPDSLDEPRKFLEI